MEKLLNFFSIISLIYDPPYLYRVHYLRNIDFCPECLIKLLSLIDLMNNYNCMSTYLGVLYLEVRKSYSLYFE